MTNPFNISLKIIPFKYLKQLIVFVKLHHGKKYHKCCVGLQCNGQLSLVSCCMHLKEICL